jgi:RalA-binding protein 1
VLCAESDEDRDSWVEMLVRYYTGTYSEDLMFDPTSGLTSVQSNPSAFALHQTGQPRASSSSETAASPAGPRTKPTSRREEISRGPAVPISQLSQDANNTKLFQSVPISEDHARSSSPSRALESSPGDRQGPSNSSTSDAQKRMIERSGLGLPSSLPDASPLSSKASLQQDNLTPAVGARANSELGDYPDLQGNRAMEQFTKRQTSLDQRPRENGRKSLYPGHGPGQTPPERVPTPDKLEGKMKISGPMNGTPIPTGFKFGGKDAPSGDSPSSSNDRREKAKSRSFWGFGKGK